MGRLAEVEKEVERLKKVEREVEVLNVEKDSLMKELSTLKLTLN